MKTLNEIKEVLQSARDGASTLKADCLTEVCGWLLAQHEELARKYLTIGLGVTQWDWTKPNHILAAEHDTTSSQVALTRRRLGIPKVWKHAHIDTNGWDWNIANSELARHHRLAIGVVVELRERAGASNPSHARTARYNPRKRPNKMESFKTLDWSMSDTELASMAGTSSERIRQVRAQLGYPKQITTEKAYEAFMKKAAGRTILSRDDFKEMQIPYTTAIRYCARAGIKVIAFKERGKTCIHPWHLVNWNLPDVVITKVWNLKDTLVGTRRLTSRMGRPLYDGRFKPPPAALEAETAAEREKAAAWFAAKAAATAPVAAQEQQP